MNTRGNVLLIKAIVAIILFAVADNNIFAQIVITYSYDAVGNRIERAPQTEVAVATVEPSVDNIESSYETAIASNSFTQEEEQALFFRYERFLHYAWVLSQETMSWDNGVRPVKIVPLDDTDKSQYAMT